MAPSGTKPYGLIGVSQGSPVRTRGPLRAVTSTGSELGSVAWASVTGIGHLFSPTTVGHGSIR